ncbi:MAG TPA: metalloregulator ArsR/SmtB family transcription factor, partial [Burkholderiales bacterium]|nr:metalloregulator ArsR/SmtB family transcription factor [Burkholderiales bacterium]
MIKAPQLLSWLRAAGEPSRLRLLALCEQGDLSVSDLAQALGQSEPRVCRHLRILSEAGLIERLRNGQWVHYRLAAGAPAASFAKGLLAQVDRGDAVFARDLDRARAETGASRDSTTRTFESRLGRALKDFVEHNAPPTRVDSALLVGVEHLELLESAASIASECTAIAHSRRAAQSARAFAERRGLKCRVLLAASPDGLCERDLARAGQSFDVVILDHLATARSDFAALLDCGRRALARNGRMWLFERYESLEVPAGKIVEHPLARLRRLLGDLGLSCE